MLRRRRPSPLYHLKDTPSHMSAGRRTTTFLMQRPNHRTNPLRSVYEYLRGNGATRRVGRPMHSDDTEDFQVAEIELVQSSALG